MLEKVPYGTPDMWMVDGDNIDKSGKPIRTIILSALRKASIRETHHTRSPAKVARTVPAGKLKSTLEETSWRVSNILSDSNRSWMVFSVSPDSPRLSNAQEYPRQKSVVRPQKSDQLLLCWSISRGA